MALVHRSLKNKLAVVGAAVGLVLVLVGWNEATRPVVGPHSYFDLAYLRATDSLPIQFSTHFVTSGRCEGCHGHDPEGLAMVDAQGRDVNVVDDWRSTMMANSARDPFFRAKVRHEVIMNPEHQVEIENKCLSCHAPLGMHEERWSGNPPFTMAHLDTSVLGNDGVSCLSCHQQSLATAGTYFSGELQFDSIRVYGPYGDDLINPAIMESFVGWTPGYGDHIVNSKVCAGCHTLVTQTLDLDGNETGDEFVEQATYHEWKNSIYSANGTHCNTCHLPRIDDPIKLAAEYIFLNSQTPFGLHHLVGGNEHMLKLLKANKDVLEIPATDVQFDSTISRTHRLLTENTLFANIALADRTDDTIYYDLRLENRAGHRFPSGYPSRRAFVEFVVLTTEGDTVFKSGRLNSDYEVEGHDVGYEPHHDVITSGDQVQIYELVMGDVNNNVTTVLERAKDPIKDDRLVPVGFSTSHVSYDTTRIAGVPISDIDFNHNTLGVEGSGSDVVHYHVAITGLASGFRAFARIYYQPVPPAWNAEMFAQSHADITAFGDMLDASDRTPTMVAADSLFLGPTGIAEAPADRIHLYPSPTTDGWVTITGDARIEVLRVYDLRGAVISTIPVRLANGWRMRLPEAAGMYMVHLRVDGTDILERVLRR